MFENRVLGNIVAQKRKEIAGVVIMKGLIMCTSC